MKRKLVQNDIQSKLGDTYQVDRPKTFDRRIKIIGINENEYNSSDDEIIKKLSGRTISTMKEKTGK